MQIETHKYRQLTRIERANRSKFPNSKGAKVTLPEFSVQAGF
jgi:hypothetical protein